MMDRNGEEIVKRASGFAANLLLNDQNLETLLTNGNVEVHIPPQLRNSVESLVIKRPLFFKDQTAAQFADAELVGRRLVVNVDDSVIERIDYQPVKLKLYESGYSSLIVRYVGALPWRNAPDVGDPETDSPFLTVKLKSEKGIRGRIRGVQSLQLDSTLGKIKVNLSKSQKIRVRGDGGLVVEMANGDRVSGTIDFLEIELINRWGDETIAVSDIDELIMRDSKKEASKGFVNRK
jgi:hypothetical protein